MKSIISNKRECYICKTTLNLQKHHIFEGQHRTNSEKKGLWVYLCMNHHTGAEGVHRNNNKLEALKRIGQKEFEKTNTRKEFIKLFTKSYL